MMKRLMVVLVILSAVCMAQTTPALKLNIPPAHTPNWDVLLNQNFTILDNSALTNRSNTFASTQIFDGDVTVTGIFTVGVPGTVLLDSSGAYLKQSRITLDPNYSIDWGVNRVASERISADPSQHVVTIWPNMTNTEQFWPDSTQHLVTQVYHAGNRSYNYNSTTSQAVIAGDSIAAGWCGGGPCDGVPGHTPTYQWWNNITVYDWAKVNVAIGGTLLKDWLVSSSTVAGQPNSYTLIDSHFAPSARYNVAVFWGCTNDLYNHFATGAQCLAYLNAWALERKRQGWKVVVTTLQSMSDATAETERESFNTLLRQQWANFADAMVDVASVSQVGAHGASANTTYFPDNKHLSQAAHDLTTPLFQTALLSIANGTNTGVMVQLQALGTAIPVKADLQFDDNKCAQWTNNTVKVCGTQAGNAVQIYTSNGLQLQVSWDGSVTLYQYKATTGTRFLCTDTTGKIVSSATACSGT